MRRFGLVVVVLAIAGCSALRDVFSAHPTTAATADGQTLTVERMAELSARVKGMPLQVENVQRLAGVWVDYTLFGLALARGDSLADSTTVLAAMWPLVSQLKWDHFHERLTASHAAFNGPQVDSAYRRGDVRVFQHILLQVPPSAAPTVAQQKETQAKSLLSRIHAARGGNFSALARQYSDDPGSKVKGGLLGVGGRGQFVSQFEDAAWQLAPGGVSAVVRSPYGFHIIRRPPLAEVRDDFARGLGDVVGGHYDSTYVANLDKQKELKVVKGAGAAVRAALQDLDDARSSNKELVTYKGGSFRVRDLVRWVHALNPQVAASIPSATDDQITQMLRALSQRSIMLAQADSAGIALTPEDWKELRTAHDSTIHTLERVMQLTPAVLKDSATTPEARARLALAKVNDYLDRLVEGRSQFAPVPPFLRDYLRDIHPWSVNQSGVQRAMERATTLRAAADSARGGPRPNNEPVPSVRPSPGGPPVVPPRR
jgi:hypothetical protein